MNILILIIVLLLFIIFIYKSSFFSSEVFSRNVVLGLFFLKLFFAGTLLGYYTFIHKDRKTADVYRYIDDAEVIHSLIQSDPSSYFKIVSGIGFDSNDTLLAKKIDATHYFYGTDISFLDSNHRFIIRLQCIIRLFSAGYIWTHLVIFAFFSFVGCWSIYKFFSCYLGENIICLIPVFFIPSVQFWGSSLLPESLQIACIGLLLFFTKRLLFENSTFKHFLYFLVSLHALFLLKPSLTLAFLLSYSLFIPFYFFQKKRLNIKTILGFLIMLIVLFLYFIPYLSEVLIAKRNEFILHALQVNATSLIDNHFQPPTLFTVIKLFPTAFLDAFFQPFLWQSFGSSFSLLFSIENLALYLFLLLVLRYFEWANWRKNYVAFIFSMCFALLVYLIIGYTIPVAGAIVRYRVVALPFLIYAVLLIVNLNKYIYDCSSNYHSKK